ADVFDVIARLREANVFFALNHLLHFYRGEVPFDRYLRLLDAVPALEVRNGAMAEAHNRLLKQIVELESGTLALTAGSGAHTLRRVGRPGTEAPGRTRDDFLDSAGRGLGIAGGAHGTAATIAADAYGVIAKYIAALAGFGPRDLPPLRHA